MRLALRTLVWDLVFVLYGAAITCAATRHSIASFWLAIIATVGVIALSLGSKR